RAKGRLEIELGSCHALKLIVRSDPIAPSDLGNTLHAPGGLHDPLEVRQVLDLNEGRAGDAAVMGLELHAADVGASRADGGGDIVVEAAAVVCLERQANGEALALLLLPVDLEPALRLVGQEEQVRTVGPVNADTPPAGDVADNRVPRDRLTTLGVAHHEAVGALNADAFAPAADAVDQALERAGLGRSGFLVEVRMQNLERLQRMDVALTDRRHQVLGVVQAQFLGDGLELLVRRLRDPAALDFALEDLAANLLRRLFLFVAQPLPDLMPRTARADVREPIPTRLRRRACENLHGFGVLQRAAQRRDLAVDLGALTMQSDFCMDGEREIQRRRALRQLNDVARRREDEDLVLIQVELEEFQKLVRRLRIELQLQHLPEPRQVPLNIARRDSAVLIEPVRRDSKLGRAMHIARANLDFE